MNFLPCFLGEIRKQSRNLLREIGHVNESADHAACPALGRAKETVEARVTEESPRTVGNPRRDSSVEEPTFNLSDRQSCKKCGRAVADDQLVGSHPSHVVRNLEVGD